MWVVYVLKCSPDLLYTGITNDIKKRLASHKTGKGGKFTRSHKPIKILHTEFFETRSLALKREAEIKKLSRARKLLMIKNSKKSYEGIGVRRK